MNELDSEVMIGQLESRGLIRTDVEDFKSGSVITLTASLHKINNDYTYRLIKQNYTFPS